MHLNTPAIQFGWKLETAPTLTNLRKGVVVTSGGQWYSRDWGHFVNDPALPWLVPHGQDSGPADGRNSLTLDAIFIMVDACAPDENRSKRQQLWPARLAKSLRLLRSHPSVHLNTMTELWNESWSTPLILISWLSPAQVVARYPDLLLLLAPSVRFVLPTKLGTGTDRPDWPPRSSDVELRKYILGALRSDAAYQHDLGNRIGPLIVASQFQLAYDTPRVSCDALAGLYRAQLPIPGQTSARTTPHILPTVDTLGVLTHLRTRLVAPEHHGKQVVIFDDDFALWKPVWEQLLEHDGIAYCVDGLNSDVVKTHSSLETVLAAGKPLPNSVREELSQLCSKASLLIVDMRLAAEDRNEAAGTARQLSGLTLVETLANLEINAGRVPIIAFTSSRRQEIERAAYLLGADCFLTKPTRFDHKELPYRFLQCLQTYLHPAYGVIAQALLKLKSTREEVDQKLAAFRGKKDAQKSIRKLRAFCEAVRSTILDLRAHLSVPPYKGLPPLRRAASDSGAELRSGEVLVTLGVCAERFDRSLHDRRRLGAVIRHFRDMAAHPECQDLIQEQDFPCLKIAVFLAAVLLADQELSNQAEGPNSIWLSEHCGRHREGEPNAARRSKPLRIDNSMATVLCLEELVRINRDEFLQASLELLMNRAKNIFRSENNNTNWPNATAGWKNVRDRLVSP